MNVDMNVGMKGKAGANAPAMSLYMMALWLNEQDGHNRIRTCDFCRVKTALYR